MHQLRGQAELAGNQDKFGQQGDSGPLYYLDSLGWGFGYAAGLAALAGAVLLARRDRTRLAILLIFPVALFLYLSLQSRFFGRWLLPVYPALALLAGYACMRGLAWVRERIPRWRWWILGAGAALLLWQPLAADARSMAVLGNTDTRAIARQWLVEHSRRGLRVVIEPAVPDRYLFRIIGGRPRNTRDDQFVNEFIRDTREEHIEYGRTLRPGAARPLPPPRLLHGDDVRADPRPRRGVRRPAGARLLPPARAGVRPAVRGQPVPGGRVPAAVQLRPQLQLLLARLRAARARDADLPAARLPAALRGGGDVSGVSRRSAGLRLGAILVLALALRLWHLRHGLPFAYNADEAEHFVPKAIGMFGDGLDPGYYENPSALTYLLYLCSRSATPRASRSAAASTRRRRRRS